MGGSFHSYVKLPEGKPHQQEMRMSNTIAPTKGTKTKQKMERSLLRKTQDPIQSFNSRKQQIYRYPVLPWFYRTRWCPPVMLVGL